MKILKTEEFKDFWSNDKVILNLYSKEQIKEWEDFYDEWHDYFLDKHISNVDNYDILQMIDYDCVKLYLSSRRKHRPTKKQLKNN